MQPVRVVAPGADPSLPLRMVAAGVGADVGLTLYVIGEGRYEAQNFPNAVVDDALLTWDSASNRSNYQDVLGGLMASHGGTWVTESAQPADLSYNIGRTVYYATTPGLAQAYFSPCSYGEPPPPTFQALDAGLGGDASIDADDAASDGASDGPVDGSGDGPGDGAIDASAPDGAPDASFFGQGDASVPPGGKGCTGHCCDFDDLNVAMRGLHASSVVVTRLRAKLPADALKAGDLRLIAAKDTSSVSNHHYVRGTNDASGGCRVPPFRSPSETGVALAVGLVAIVSLLRRRSR
jgi:hypothetical protein